MPAFDPAIQAYYDRGEEATRLLGDSAVGVLELARTQELIERHLPAGELEILDVGGGPGVYAGWLSELGHRVHLVDPVALHLDQAADADARVTVELGDARALSQSDGSADVALLLGPLYHLQDREERLLALSEARRVLRPGGLVFAAGISRMAGLLDLLRLDLLHQPGLLQIVTDSIATGVFDGDSTGLFTNGYFHRPTQLATEVGEAGFVAPKLFGIEGPGAWVDAFADRWADPERREAILGAARLTETDPEMLAAANHLLVVAWAPGA